MIASLLLSTSLMLTAQLAKPGDDDDGPYTEPYPVESLAEIMGSLHAIAFNCAGRNTQDWRDAMVELLDHEAPTRGAHRERLISRFNQGFRDIDNRRVRCGAEAEFTQQRLAARGQVLSEQLRRTYLD